MALLFPASADAASVTVQSGAGSRTLDLAALRQDVSQEYTVSGAAGEQRVPIRGTSLNGLFESAKPDLFGVRSYEISGGGRTVVLAPDQLSGAGQGSPVVYAENGQAVFLRPKYSPDDLNGDDRLVAPSLRVRVLKRPTLKVSAKASTAAVRVGEAVTFTASTTGAAAGKELTYRWTLDDGSRRQRGDRVTHRFRERGSYVVSVSATTPDDRVGATGLIRVRVGPAPKGPDRKGGGTDDAASAPSSGTAAGGDSGASGGTGQADSGPARAPEAAPSRPRRSRPAPDPGGREVEGTLLADATAVPPRPSARKRAARTGNDQEGDSGPAVPAAAWGLMATLGLAGAGALIELRPLLAWPRRTA